MAIEKVREIIMMIHKEQPPVPLLEVVPVPNKIKPKVQSTDEHQLIVQNIQEELNPESQFLWGVDGSPVKQRKIVYPIWDTAKRKARKEQQQKEYDALSSTV